MWLLWIVQLQRDVSAMTMRIDMSEALYLELEGAPEHARVPTSSEHPGRVGLVHAIGSAEKRQRKRGGDRVRTTYRMDLSPDVQFWMVASALPNAISILKDHGDAGSRWEAGHMAGALKAARNLLAKLEAATGIRPAITDADRYPNQQPAKVAKAGKKAEYSDPKTPTPDELARPQKEVKERSKANAPTKQRRRQEAAQEAANGKDRIGVPRMQTLLDTDGGSLLVSARPAGSEDGLVQYYVRIATVEGHRLVRERLVSGVAGYQRLAKGIARGHDSSKNRIVTKLGTRLQEEGMEL